MGAASIQQMADRVAGLMEERLRLGGDGLAAKLAKGARLLPRRVREAAERLARAAMMAQNPKLLFQIDEEQVAEDYDLCLRHLLGVSVWDRRKGWMLGAAVSVLGTVAVVGMLTAGVLYWRGLI
ncbi:MAG: hypothetical protein ACT4OK_22385 [Gemmobacter sp.]